MSEDWFTVDKKGLAQLYADKPKYIILRELVQNALDEARNKIYIEAVKSGKMVTISVEDDGGGFRSLEDCYRLFGDTYKRYEPEKRGRFNTGEKWAFSLCKSATVFTTSGTVTFGKRGRKINRRTKKESGTIVTVTLQMNSEEYQDMWDYMRTWIIPKELDVYMENRIIGRDLHENFFKTFEATLPSEFATKGGNIRPTKRKTYVNLYKSEGKSQLYEMGIPVFDVDLPYSVDVQQKIPLNSDRDMVTNAFRKAIYTEVLNNSFEELTKDTVSEPWVRIASESKDVDSKAIEKVLDTRYGTKRVVFTPGDPNANDEAISRGYRVIHGGDMSKGEWENTRNMEMVKSSSDMFGTKMVEGEEVDLTQGMILTKAIAQSIAKKFQHHTIKVRFLAWDGSRRAQYGDRTLTFNVRCCGEGFFKIPFNNITLALIIHEIAHECGNHTEHSYHREITRLGAEMVITALYEPKFFKEWI